MAIQVRPYQPQAPDQLQMLSSRVLLENVDENVQQWILTLLIENVSGLSEEDLEFSVEMIPERYVAVITFFKPIGKKALVTEWIQGFFKGGSSLKNRVSIELVACAACPIV